jgi:hypothetical protein
MVQLAVHGETARERSSRSVSKACIQTEKHDAADRHLHGSNHRLGLSEHEARVQRRMGVDALEADRL